jgi:NADPH-dependent 2,4-dienoyl-CoA reductase/sulfur reductase-like enzyme
MRGNRTAGSHIPVAIVGAGPVGLSLAPGLACQGVRSVLLERNPQPAHIRRVCRASVGCRIGTGGEPGVPFV